MTTEETTAAPVDAHLVGRQEQGFAEREPVA